MSVQPSFCQDLVGHPVDRFSQSETAHKLLPILWDDHADVNVPISCKNAAIWADQTDTVMQCGNNPNGLFYEVQAFLRYEPPHGKTNNLHRRKQRRRSASQ